MYVITSNTHLHTYVAFFQTTAQYQHVNADTDIKPIHLKVQVMPLIIAFFESYYLYRCTKELYQRTQPLPEVFGSQTYERKPLVNLN